MKCAILDECEDRPWCETVRLSGREHLIVEVPDELYEEWRTTRDRMFILEAQIYALRAPVSA